MAPSIRSKHILATAALLLSGTNSLHCNAFTTVSKTGLHQSFRSSSNTPQSKLFVESSMNQPYSMQQGGRRRQLQQPQQQQQQQRLSMEQRTTTTAAAAAATSSSSIETPSFLQDFAMPIFWTSLLITSNTVGAGMLVLPELCQGPGMATSMGLFLFMYALNLVSGLMIAEVAITQKERSGKDAPSSFKAFAEENLDNPMAKDIIATISVVKNALVLAFGTMKAGQLGHDVLGVNADMVSIVWAMVFASLLGTQSAPKLSKVASVFVAGLFSTFAAILIPGLAHMDAPVVDILMTPGTSTDPMTDLLSAAPIILMSFIFQNIVPTAARILDYDRTKIAVSMSIGTFFPFLMYAAWCLAVLGGGVDTAATGLDGPLFTIFSIVTIAGSHLGSSTSMAEELDTYLRSSFANEDDSVQVQANSMKDVSEEEDRKNDVFSWASVGITAALAIGLGEGFAGNLNDLLSIAGAYGSPLLYFALPVIMMWNQQQQDSFLLTEDKDEETSNPLLQSLWTAESTGKNDGFRPNIPLALTASAATGILGTGVFHML